MASQIHGITADPGIELEDLPLHLFLYCPTTLPAQSLIYYGRTANVTESIKIPGHPDPNENPNDTSENAIVALRRGFRLICLLHKLGLTMKGNFSGNRLIIDSTFDVKLYGIHLSKFSRADGDDDYSQFIWIVEDGLFRGNVPALVRQWLDLMGRGIASYECLLCYHIALMELNQAVDCLLALYNIFTALESSDRDLYWEIVDWLDKYDGWKQVDSECVNDLVSASRKHRKHDKKRVFYHDDVRGALKLSRDCVEHPAKRFTHLFTLIMSDDFPILLSDFQEAMNDAGLLQSLRHDITML